MNKPKFKLDDWVKFNLKISNDISAEIIGKVIIVDRFGTFEQHKEPSYDLLSAYCYEESGEYKIDYDSECIYKHIVESRCTKSRIKEYKITIKDNK